MKKILYSSSATNRNMCKTHE